MVPLRNPHFERVPVKVNKVDLIYILLRRSELNKGGPFPLSSQHIRSDQIVSEREGAMGTRRNQEILPMGREEQGVEAHFKGPRMQVENPAAGVMAIHGEPPSVEGIAGGNKDEEVQTSSGASSRVIQARVSTVVERVVQGVEIGTLMNGCPGRVEITVVVDHILLQACDGLNGRTMTNCSMCAQVGSHHLFALDLHHTFWHGLGAFREIEARAEGRSQPIREPGEVGYFVPLIPALQILKQMREVHGGSVLEVAVGRLIGQSGQALHVADERRA